MVVGICCAVVIVIGLVSWTIYRLTIPELAGDGQPGTLELGLQAAQSAFIRGTVIAGLAGIILVVIIYFLLRLSSSKPGPQSGEFEVLSSHTFMDAPIGIAVCTPAGGVIRSNNSLCRILGCPAQNGNIRELATFIHPADRAEWEAGLERVLAGHETNSELVVRAGNQPQPGRWVRSVITLIDKPGETAYLIIEISDITELKSAQEDLRQLNEQLGSRIEQRTLELRQTEDRLQVVTESAGIGMWDWDISTGKTTYNRGWAELLGYEPAEIEPDIETWRSLLHPADLDRTYAVLEANLEGRSPVFDTEHRLRNKDGGWTWVQAWGKVTERDQDGKALRHSGATINVNERKLIEEELNHHREQLEALVKERTEQLERSEDELRHLFTAMMTGFSLHEIICDEAGNPVDYRFLFVNPSFERITGLKAEDVVGRTVLEILPATEKFWIEQYGKVALTGKPARFEQYSGGLKKHYEVSTYQPSPGQFACIINDVTERRMAEREKELTARLYSLGHSTDDLQSLVQQFLHHIHDWTGCQSVGLRLRDGDDYPYFSTSGFPDDFASQESSLCATDGDGNPIRNGQDRPVLDCICGAVINGGMDPAKPFHTEHGSFWTANLSELLTTQAGEATWPRSRNRCLRAGYESLALIPLVSAGDTFGLLQLNDHRPGMFDADRLEVCEQIAEVIASVIARRRAEDALVESKHELQVLINIADILLRYPGDEMYAKVLDIVLFELDSEFGFFAYISAEGHMVAPSMTTRIYDQCQIPGKTIEFPPEAWGGIWGQALQEHRTCIKNSGLLTPEGHIPLATGMSTPIIHQEQVIGELTVGNRPGGYGEQEQAVLEHIAVFLAPVLAARLKAQRDEAERRRLEAQLRQSQKLEAIGTLAGGIAHDFNNMLYAMLGNISLARSSLTDDHEACEFLAEADTAGHRAAELVKQILTFARKADKQRGPIHVASIIKEVTRLLRSTTPTTIEIRYVLDAACTTVHADPIEVHQVIMNLCGNAAQAMQESGGILSIEITDKVPEGEGPRHMPHPLRIRISDTGPGISPGVQSHIFEPFFTTKAQGEGTGMGLAVVHGIIRDLKGTITVSSEPGQGTAFEIYLPLMDEHCVDELSSEEARHLPRGTEHILVVDDEPSITAMICNTLKLLGYECSAYTSSLEALGAFKATPGLYDAVITDQTMPGMTGGELATEMLRIRPALPILLCTGYSRTLPGEKAQRLGIAAYLTKPMAAADITTTLRAVLDSRRD